MVTKPLQQDGALMALGLAYPRLWQRLLGTAPASSPTAALWAPHPSDLQLCCCAAQRCLGVPTDVMETWPKELILLRLCRREKVC